MPTRTISRRSRPSTALPDKDNFRNLPGCPPNKRASFYRSRNLHGIDKAFQEKILTSRIRSVIDLRGEEEWKAKEDDLSFLKENGIQYVPCGIRDILHYGDEKSLKDRLSNDYLDILFHHQDALLSVFQNLARLPKPILFHCNAGKDRTGVVAMLLLGLNDIPKEVILKDYHRTEENLPLMAKEGYIHYKGERPDFVCHAMKKTMEETIDYLLRKTSYRKYLLSLGISLKELASLSLFE